MPRRPVKVAPLVLAAFALACGSGSAVSPNPTPTASSPNPTDQLNALQQALTAAMITPPELVQLPTYDFTNESVHPSVLQLDGSWTEKKCVILFTPYHGSNGHVENPSVASSDDCRRWTVPEGVTNPFVGGYPGTSDYNSDPDQDVDSARQEIVAIYRIVRADSNRIMITTSKDGARFAAPRLAFKEPSHQAVSPSILISPKGDGSRDARVWYVDAGPDGCFTKSSKVKMRTASVSSSESFRTARWSAPLLTDLHQPGYVIWHLNVMKLADGYLAIYSAMPEITAGSGCLNEDEFIALSKNGISWRTFNVPFRWHSMDDLPLATLYRASTLMDPSSNVLRVWFSGMDLDKQWWPFYTEYRYNELIAALQSAPPLTIKQRLDLRLQKMEMP